MIKQLTLTSDQQIRMKAVECAHLIAKLDLYSGPITADQFWELVGRIELYIRDGT